VRRGQLVARYGIFMQFTKFSRTGLTVSRLCLGTGTFGKQTIEVIVHRQLSPDLARGLLQGKLDVAIFRREDHVPGLAFKLLTKEPSSSFCPAITASPRAILFARKTFRAKPSSVFPRRHHQLSGPSSTAMRRAPDSILPQHDPSSASQIFRKKAERSFDPCASLPQHARLSPLSHPA
jgi:hypothetical protein